jgi:hypothetical protein
MAGAKLIYRPSNKHCEPLTAAKPGTKCPRWSVAIAQELLDTSEPMGEKRVNTRHGLAFVAQTDNNGTWHGYPEAWDKIDRKLVSKWRKEGRVTGSHLHRWRDLKAVRAAWKELEDAE